MPEGTGPSRARRLFFAVPLIALALCLLEVFPWLTAAQGDRAHAAGYAIGAIALVSYPVLLAAVALLSDYFRRRNATIRAALRVVWVGLFGALLVAFSVALVLTRL